MTSRDAKGEKGEPGDHARVYVSIFLTKKSSSDLFICVIWTTILKANIKYSMLLEKNANSV
jgi:hypothetical protein